MDSSEMSTFEKLLDAHEKHSQRELERLDDELKTLHRSVDDMARKIQDVVHDSLKDTISGSRKWQYMVVSLLVAGLITFLVSFFLLWIRGWK